MSEKPPPTREQLIADERGRYRVQAEWISQATLINVGLIVLDVYVVSALITTGAGDFAARVAIVAWAVAMPLIAVLSLTTELQRRRTYASYPWYFVITQAVAPGCGGHRFRGGAMARLVRGRHRGHPRQPGRASSVSGVLPAAREGQPA